MTLIRTPDDDERDRPRRDLEWLWLALVVLVALTVANGVLGWLWPKAAPTFQGGGIHPEDP